MLRAQPPAASRRSNASRSPGGITKYRASGWWKTSAEAAAETEVDARPVQGGPVESLVSLTNTQSLVTPFGARCFMKPNMYPAMRRIWISSVPSVMR